jgi:cell division protein FtsB
MKKTSLVSKIVIILLAAYAVVTLLKQQIQLNSARDDLDSVHQQIESAERENEELEEKLSEQNSEDFGENAVRDQLGYIKPGEAIFVDVSN